MNILIVGTGKGSWTIRGQQLGAALGARVTSSPAETDYAWADRVILVKRAILTHGAEARRAGRPIVWDALDFWSQPAQNTLDEAAAVRAARQHMALASPDLVVAATEVMARQLGGVYLPHHAWAGLRPGPVAERMQCVAYEGNPVYLGRWFTWLERACARRGWTFVVNPPELRAADLLVAFRDGQWDGWLCRAWKSGVKYVNALAAGRPVIGQDAAARQELDPPGSVVEHPDELDEVFDIWSTAAVRQQAADRGRARAQAFTVEAVAAQYRAVLEAMPCPA